MGALILTRAFALIHAANLAENRGKTARKMSEAGRTRALAEFDLPDPFAAAFHV